MASLSLSLFTDKNDLSASLTARLSKQNCNIDLVTQNKDYYINCISEKINIYSYSEFKARQTGKKYDYILFIYLNQDDTRQDPTSFEETSRIAVKIAKRNLAKVLYVFPYVHSTYFKEKINQIKKKFDENQIKNSTIVYIGELLGSEIAMPQQTRLGKLLVDVVVTGTVNLHSKNEHFYPVSLKSVISQITKSLFSFGYFGKEVAITSTGLSNSKFAELMREEIPDLRIRYKRRKSSYLLADCKGKIVIKLDYKKHISQTIKNITRNRSEFVDAFTKKSIRTWMLFQKKRLESGKAKIFKSGYKVAVLLLIAPTLALFFISASQLIANMLLYNNKVNLSAKLFNATEKTSIVLRNYLEILPTLPFGNLVIDPSAKAAGILVRNSQIGIKYIYLISKYYDLYGTLIGEEEANVEKISSDLSFELDHLFQEISFVEAEIESLKGPGKKLFISTFALEKARLDKGKILNLKNISAELSMLLGVNNPKTYLVILQNNLDLKPTGGRIASVLFVTISKGKIENIEVFNTDSIDNLLKGYVEPPANLKKYIKDSWYLRDSNWDPDFPTSAQQLEWFIDKEMDRSVDGVIALDMDFVKEALTISGPLKLESLDAEVAYNNVFLTSEVEYDKEFWSEILSRLADKIVNFNDDKKVKLLETTFESLESKHMQIFLHNNNAQRALSGLGWAGALQAESCFGNCLSDFVAPIESSTGEGNSNQFLNKASELNLVFEEGVIKHVYTVVLENISQESPKNTTPYSYYFRVIVPENSGFSPIIVSKGQESNEVSPDVFSFRGFKEAGTIVELFPYEKVVLHFSWESPEKVDFQKEGEYRLFVRKQAGIQTFPTKINVEFPSAVRVKETPGLLTNESKLEYNTELARDFVSRIYW